MIIVSVSLTDMKMSCLSRSVVGIVIYGNLETRRPSGERTGGRGRARADDVVPACLPCLLCCAWLWRVGDDGGIYMIVSNRTLAAWTSYISSISPCCLGEMATVDPRRAW